MKRAKKPAARARAVANEEAAERREAMFAAVDEVVDAMGDWLHINGRAIYASRPWRRAEDGANIRFTVGADGALNVIALQWRGVNTATNGVAFPDTTVDRPYLTQTQLNDDLRLNKTTSAGLTLDFKLSPRQVETPSTTQRLGIAERERRRILGIED